MSSPRSSVFCDIVCVTLAVVALYMSVSMFMDHMGLERSDASSGSGFHLLSCPKLFESADDTANYNDIHLSQESTDQLMTMLKESLEHAHVLHTGKDNHGVRRGISQAVEQQIGNDEEVDINVPRKSDNNHLCDILKTILDEQGDSSTADDGHVTISIMKLETEEQESLFLRGARLFRSAPIVDRVLKLTNLDDKLEKLITKAQAKESKEAKNNSFNLSGLDGAVVE